MEKKEDMDRERGRRRKGKWRRRKRTAQGEEVGGNEELEEEDNKVG